MPRIHKKSLKKLTSRQEHALIKQVLSHPTESLVTVAKKYEISAVTLWKLLKKHNLHTRALRQKHRLSIGKQLRKDISYKERCHLVREFLQGKSVTLLSQKAGISRTILYRWISLYKQGGYAQLQSHRPRNESHWKHVPGSLREVVTSFVLKYPNETLDSLYRIFKKEEQKMISKSMFYITLRRFDLNTSSRRLAFASTGKRISILERQLTNLNSVVSISHSSISSSSKPRVIPVSLWDIFRLVMLMSAFLTVWTAVTFGLFSNVSLFSSQSDQPSIVTVTHVPLSSTPFPTSPSVLTGPIDSKQGSNFSWGVLVLNTHKSSYASGETIQFGFGVLDPQGQTICDAELELQIRNQSGNEEVFSTANGRITRSKTCSLTSVTHVADYAATIASGYPEGTYAVQLTATTAYGSKTITDTLLVEKKPFEIVRTDFPTRIYPGSPYWLGFTVVAQEDFVGEIRESVPGYFSVSGISDGGQQVFRPESQRGDLVWRVILRKGQLYRFSYTMSFPQISPELYQLGAIKLLNEQGSVVFEEGRAWQIAADAI